MKQNSQHCLKWENQEQKHFWNLSKMKILTLVKLQTGSNKAIKKKILLSQTPKPIKPKPKKLMKKQINY